MPVTIGLPFYNAEDFLVMALKSIYAQTYTDWELILMDDGSTDNSMQIVRRLKDPRIRVYSDGKNKKLAARLNEIVRLAKYDYIVRMDADDLMSTRRIETQMQVFDRHMHLDLVSTGTISINNELEYFGSRGVAKENITTSELLKKKGSPLHASIIGKKSWFLRNPYNESLKIAQDYELWIRSSKQNDFRIKTIPDRLYYYREENNAKANKILAAYRNERQMIKKYGESETNSLLIKSLAKSMAVKFISSINREEWLLRRRSSANNGNSEERETYLNELKIIKNTTLPFT